MKKILFAIVMLATGGALLTGCRTPGPYLPRDAGPHVEDSSRFVLLDRGAERSVTVSGIQEARLQDGRLQVVANVRNRENRRIQVQINCEFKDAQGFVVEATPFQNLFLDEYAQQGVSFVSMNDRAMRYTVRVRQAR
jgi:hypothetical protein